MELSCAIPITSPNALRLVSMWLWGGAAYSLCELIWRGFCPPLMFVIGGLCFVLLGELHRILPRNFDLFQQTLLGAAAVTAIELLCGLILNKSLNLGIWDYSGLPLNLWGQICPQYAALWIPLSAAGITLNRLLSRRLFGAYASVAEPKRELSNPPIPSEPEHLPIENY